MTHSLSKEIDNLNRNIQVIISKLTNIHPDLFQALKYFLSQEGKKLRPRLLLATAKLFSANKPINCMPTALAIELLHNYTLIHDDLPSMDDAKQRRSKPTVHIKFGEAIAILAGDGLQALAYEQLAKQQTASIKGLSKLIDIFSSSSGFLGIIDGQAKDIDQVNKFSISKINSLKTAKLFSFATEAPAIIYGLKSDDENRILLKDIGLKYGLAYQLYDDILDGLDDNRQIDIVRSKKEMKNLLCQAVSMIKQLKNLNDEQALVNFPRSLAKLIE